MSASTTPISEKSAARPVPCKLAHVVLRTSQLSKMLAWYRTVFLAKTTFEAPVIAFLTYDDEHHRIAFLSTPHLPMKDKKVTGVDHFAFTYASLQDLLATWERLKSDGIEPYWCINHGMTTSMYYRDPDGNEIELQVDNFDTMDACKGWFSSEAFAQNPIGVQYDPAVLFKKLKSGVSVEDLVKLGAAPIPPEREFQFMTLAPEGTPH